VRSGGSAYRRGMRTFFDSIRGIRFRRGPARLLGGIAGGLAEVTGLNVWLVRLLVLLSFLLPFVGIGLYAAVWLLTPWQDGSIPLERAVGGHPER
jgi:phage shock protein C